MRSAPTGTYERLSAMESLWFAWLDVRRNKRRQPRIAAFDLDADSHLFRLHRSLASGSYRPSPYRLSLIRDPKLRLIAAPAMVDRVVQRALISEIGPTYSKSFIDQSFSCLWGRGPHRAVMSWLNYARQYRYCLIMDIRHYFPSIHHTILLDLFAHRLRDEKTVTLIQQMIASGGEVYQTPAAIHVLGESQSPWPINRGLPLGGFFSHWSGDFYLDGLDHYVKRVLKAAAYQRYMDDFALFHHDPIFLAEARIAIQEWLWQQRGLLLKPKTAPIQPTSQPITCLGFRVSRAGTSPGPKAKRRLKQRLANPTSLDTQALARSLQSYRGMMLALG